MFDFTKARQISQKIIIENNPAKIDRFLARLHATISEEFEHTRPRTSIRTTSKARTPRPGI